MTDKKEKLAEELENNRNEYLNFLKKLIKTDTRVVGHGIDGGYEKNGQKIAAEKMEEIGGKAEFYKVKDEIIRDAIEKYGEGNPGHNYEDRPNLLGRFSGSGGGRSLILNGHIDTMPYGEKERWKYDPFSAKEIDGEIYGLGSCDMKGGLAASLLSLDLIKKAGIELKGDVLFESVIDEEGGGNGTLAFVQEGIKADGAVVCEPTSNLLQIGHMGFIFYHVKVFGKALHSSRKWEGVNAIEKAIKLIEALNELEHNWLMKYKHPLMPPPTLNIGVIKGGSAGSTVPSECEFKLCLHYYPGLDKEEIAEDVLTTLDNAVKGDPWLRENPLEIEVYQEGGPFEIDSEHDLVKTFRSNISGSKELTASPAGNDARLLANLADTPTIVFGPGNPEKAHSIDETISINEYIESILIYAGFIIDWCGTV
ncbi:MULTISPECIES: ArgE/DapE family deacylase [unclassified Halanaerobium]|uniref:ArgE/DapE family deacylase n=1 Tax=unclassified Halanaerobium TaxID=2641197 RepID=UPI000DF232D3|nr:MULTISPECIES: ArgE/DapE family deacylase [unclassified Halanaerobium]RCW43764.1 acetylornithine deacetylase [Halanaerobium sp. MA284_MarDTE_T2]RCW89167.1 acetylornithine deacetylase [Halanaerobium sp. DL-01]